MYIVIGRFKCNHRISVVQNMYTYESLSTLASIICRDITLNNFVYIPPKYYISQGITRIFSLPEGYKGGSYFPPSGYYLDQSEPLF